MELTPVIVCWAMGPNSPRIWFTSRLAFVTYDFSLDNRDSSNAVDRNLMGRVKDVLRLYNTYTPGTADLATLDTDWSLSESD